MQFHPIFRADLLRLLVVAIFARLSLDLYLNGFFRLRCLCELTNHNFVLQTRLRVDGENRQQDSGTEQDEQSSARGEAPSILRSSGGRAQRVALQTKPGTKLAAPMLCYLS